MHSDALMTLSCKLRSRTLYSRLYILFQYKIATENHVNLSIRRMQTVSGIEGLPDAETRANRGEGEGHDGDVLCTGQSHPTAGGHPETQKHLPQPCRGGLRRGPGASQANQKTRDAKNVDRESPGIILHV